MKPRAGTSTSITWKIHSSLAAKIDGELINDPDFHINVREFACNFDIKVVNLKGSVEITKQSTWMPEIVQLENNNEAGLNFHLKIV